MHYEAHTHKWMPMRNYQSPARKSGGKVPANQAAARKQPRGSRTAGPCRSPGGSPRARPRGGAA